MPLSNTSRQYGSVAKTFHWLTALMILTAIPLGWIASDMAHDINDPAVPTTIEDISRTFTLFSIHKTLGVTIFFVALARILWTITQTRPGLLNAENKPEAFAAEIVHWLLYGALILVPLTGWMHHAATEGFAPIAWPFGQNLPFVPKSEWFAEFFGGLHWVFQWVLVAALTLHVVGALKHHVIDRDATLRRMLPGSHMAPQPPKQPHSPLPAITAIVLWGAALAYGVWIGSNSEKTTPVPNLGLAQVQSDWHVESGNLGITVTQAGNPVKGAFADWTAAISFEDPARPGPAGTVDVTVSIASLTIGSVTDQAKGPDFFDAMEYPTATFKAELLKTETGYEARGPLTIRDQTHEVVLPFTLDLQEGTAVMVGDLALNRLDFGVGSNVKDEASLNFAVDVNIELTAKRSE